jgi:hypothetical protein
VNGSGRGADPQPLLRSKRIELRGRGDERHPVDLRVDQPDRAAHDVCSSKNAGVQRGLDVAEESGHDFVRLSLKGVIGLEGTPQFTDERLGGLDPRGERLVSPHRVPECVDARAASLGTGQVAPSDRENGPWEQVVRDVLHRTSVPGRPDTQTFTTPSAALGLERMPSHRGGRRLINLTNRGFMERCSGAVMQGVSVRLSRNCPAGRRSSGHYPERPRPAARRAVARHRRGTADPPQGCSSRRSCSPRLVHEEPSVLSLCPPLAGLRRWERLQRCQCYSDAVGACGGARLQP